MGLPFGQAVRVWRAHRGMTQARLAAAAGLPRPNLSAIERGQREASLTTLRALASALRVSPGTLVDGIVPALPQDPARLRRPALERIANASVSGRPLHDPTEQALAAALRLVAGNRPPDGWPRRALRRQRRASQTAWLQLTAWCPPAVLQSLVQRVEDRLRRHEPIPS